MLAVSAEEGQPAHETQKSRFSHEVMDEAAVTSGYETETSM
jgi:hypothetical protein